MNARRKVRLVLERLEDRFTPASFNLVYSHASLSITQSAPLAGATDTLNISDNVTANMIILTDAGAGGNTTNVNTAGVSNVSLNLLPNTVANTTRVITYDLGPSGRAGNLKLNLSTGNQSLDINDNGGSGPVLGSLSVEAGAGSDSIMAALTGTLAVTTSTSISLGNGTQTISLGSTAIGDDLNLTTKNGPAAISLGAGIGQTFTVAGNVDIDTGTGANTLTMGQPGVGTAAVDGRLSADGMTSFTLNPGSSIGGRLSLDAGTRPMTYTFVAGSTVGDDVDIRNQGNTPLATSTLVFNGAMDDDLRVSLGNTAGDTITMSGSVGGDMSVDAGNNGKTISLTSGASVGRDFSACLGNALAGVNLVSITAGAQVGRSVYVSLGNTTNPGGNMVNLSGAQIGGSVTVYGGAGADTYLSSSAADTADGPTFIGGSVYIDLGGGANTATISGTVGGHSIDYRGGAGNDTVLIDATSYASIYVDFDAAPKGTTKSVTLGVLPRSAFIDFGVGSGTKTLTLTGTATPVTYPLTVKHK